jgi:hypothetical protein
VVKLRNWNRETQARTGPLMRKHHVLARRLLTREDDYLRYITDPQDSLRQQCRRKGKFACQSSGSRIGLHAEHRVR